MKIPGTNPGIFIFVRRKGRFLPAQAGAISLVTSFLLRNSSVSNAPFSRCFPSRRNSRFPGPLPPFDSLTPLQRNKKNQTMKSGFSYFVRRKGIEPLSPAWKAGILPLNQHRDRNILLYFCTLFQSVRRTGIEPVSQPWEGRVLPLNQHRVLDNITIHFRISPVAFCSVGVPGISPTNLFSPSLEKFAGLPSWFLLLQKHHCGLRIPTEDMQMSSCAPFS